ncbi:hypothetical protein [Mammaliicoccus sciuri]|uniref:hypothetical protein n=1 Tax=Mammaliicoccus sciuri TaxID=1296 RepID=UPI002DB9147B|nr:hypothetical protein [Mammaliicoccus sciuri]MEB6232596.1 hypothetical protein [Mammaliicoccus sciuri]
MTNNNLTTEQKFFRFQDIVDENVLILSKTDLTVTYIADDILSLLTELNSIIYTTLELTEITQEMIDKHLQEKLNMTYDTLIVIEENNL